MSLDAKALRLLNLLREAVQDDKGTARMSAPEEAEPGEFYVLFEGERFAVRIEPL